MVDDGGISLRVVRGTSFSPFLAELDVSLIVLRLSGFRSAIHLVGQIVDLDSHIDDRSRKKDENDIVDASKPVHFVPKKRMSVSTNRRGSQEHLFPVVNVHGSQVVNICKDHRKKNIVDHQFTVVYGCECASVLLHLFIRPLPLE